MLFVDSNMFFSFSMKLTGRKHSSQSPQCNETMLHATALLVVISHLAHDTKMASGAENPRPTSSRYKTVAALLKPSQQKRRTQHQRMATIAPFHLQRFQTFSEHCCSHRLRADVCRVVPFLSFLCANLARAHTFNQPLHGAMLMSNPSCPTSFQDGSWLNCCPYQEHTAQPLGRNQPSCSPRPAKSIHF